MICRSGFLSARAFSPIEICDEWEEISLEAKTEEEALKEAKKKWDNVYRNSKRLAWGRPTLVCVSHEGSEKVTREISLVERGWV